jgi:hypothetical protein
MDKHDLLKASVGEGANYATAVFFNDPYVTLNVADELAAAVVLRVVS